MPALESIAPAGAAPAKGPYSPAIRCGALLFVSGQIALMADGTPLAGADLEAQTRQCLANLSAVLQAAGCGLDRVAKVTIYCSEADGWPVINRVYAEVFGAHRPARAIVPTAAFPGGFKIEIDAVAVLPD